MTSWQNWRLRPEPECGLLIFEYQARKNPLKQLLTIDLFGQPYHFNVEKNFSQAKEIADLFVKEVQRVEEKIMLTSNGTNKTAVLILAALNIAQENKDLKNKQSIFHHKIKNRVDAILKMLDGNDYKVD